MRRGPRTLGAAAFAFLAATGCRALDPNPEAIWSAVFESPFAELKEVSSGGIAWQGHDAWIAFRSDVAPRLKHEKQFNKLPLADARSFLREAEPCRAVLASPDPICLLYSDTEKNVLNGVVVVFTQDRTRGCIRSWEHS